MFKQKHRIRYVQLLAVCALLIGVLSACGSQAQQSASGIKVEMATQPAELKAKQDAKLIATVTGLKSTNGVDVYFEVKKQGDKKREVLKVDEGNGNQGVYTAKTSFFDAAKYDIYVHVVTPDAHETVKKTVTVTAP